MGADDVLRVLELLEGIGVRLWVAGGWGIDALLGEQTRTHRDLDLAIDARDGSKAFEALQGTGYRLIDAEDWRPSRFAMADRFGHKIDLHPVTFVGRGAGRQANISELPPFEYPADGFTHGMIHRRHVPCITAALQVRFHEGHALSDAEQRDMRALHERFGVGPP